MNYYAIRQKSTGYFLPAVGRGFTATDFLPQNSPRLFRSKAAAKTALTWWLKGMIRVHRYQDNFGEWDEDWKLVPLNRNPKNAEVVQVELKISFHEVRLKPHGQSNVRSRKTA